MEEEVALLSVSAVIISVPGLCRTSSWTSCDAASNQSSRREPLMSGSVALPGLFLLFFLGLEKAWWEEGVLDRGTTGVAV